MRKQDTPETPETPGIPETQHVDAPAPVTAAPTEKIEPTGAAPAAVTAPDRERARAARFVRQFGEDAVWAMQGWTGVPKPVLRFGTCCIGALASWWFDIDGVAQSILEMFGVEVN